MSSKIHNPHDNLFRASMSDLRIAKDFLQNYLPAEIIKLIDFDTLTVEKESYIDKHLRPAMVDMLYSVNIAGQLGYIYILVEHQSNPDKWMPLRLFYYLLSILKESIDKKQGKCLPVIYPLVFYTGKDKYSYSTDIASLFAGPKGLGKELLFKPFQLIDLNEISDEKIKKQKWAGLMSLVFKHAQARSITSKLQELAISLRHFDRAGNIDYIQNIFVYLLDVSKAIEDKEMA